jgi:hypothetical protein
VLVGAMRYHTAASETHNLVFSALSLNTVPLASGCTAATVSMPCQPGMACLTGVAEDRALCLRPPAPPPSTHPQTCISTACIVYADTPVDELSKLCAHREVVPECLHPAAGVLRCAGLAEVSCGPHVHQGLCCCLTTHHGSVDTLACDKQQPERARTCVSACQLVHASLSRIYQQHASINNSSQAPGPKIVISINSYQQGNQQRLRAHHVLAGT